VDEEWRSIEAEYGHVVGSHSHFWLLWPWPRRDWTGQRQLCRVSEVAALWPSAGQSPNHQGPEKLAQSNDSDCASEREADWVRGTVA